MSGLEALLYMALGALLLACGQAVAVLGWALRRWGTWR